MIWPYLLAAFCLYVLLFLSACRTAWAARLLAVALTGGGLWMVFFHGGVDPFAWACALLGSWAAVRAGTAFGRWTTAKMSLLSEEVTRLTQKLRLESVQLEDKRQQAELAARHAEEITYFYDKIKEMSQSLELYETFLIFGEAVARHFHFERIKLVLYNAEEPAAAAPDEVYELLPQDFRGIFDKSRFLADKKKRKAELFPSDRGHLETAFAGTRTSFSDGQGLSVYPVRVQRKIAAVLFLSGVTGGEARMLSILVERFASETQRVKLYQKVETLATTDGLTGVLVRRYLLERFEREIERSRRFGLKLSFLMIDIDHFKHFNDHYGHLVGDVVLKQVADTVRLSVRELDLAARYGGEEFGVLLIETDEATAFFIAQRIRQAVEEKPFRAYDENLNVTVSVGCATFSDTLSSASLLIDAADSALYQAKRQGRNKVCQYTVAQGGQERV